MEIVALIATVVAALSAAIQTYYTRKQVKDARTAERTLEDAITPVGGRPSGIHIPTAAEIEKYSQGHGNQLQREQESALSAIHILRHHLARGLNVSLVALVVLVVMSGYLGYRVWVIWTLTRTATAASPGCIASPSPRPSTGPFIDVKVNGCDGILTLTNGESFAYSWETSNVTACQMQAPGLSGISVSGADGAIRPEHPWYPEPGESVALAISCTDGTRSVSDGVVIRLASPLTP